MMNGHGYVVALLVGIFGAPAWGNGAPGTTDEPARNGFVAIQCTIDGDNEQDSVRLYHSQSRNANGWFDSVAVFLQGREGHLIPVHIITYESRFPNMLWVEAVDLDDDGLSEFVIGTTDAGVSRVHTRVSVLDIAISPEGTVSAETRFQHDAEHLSQDEVRFEMICPGGHYRMRIGEKSFHLKNGYDLEN